MEFYDQDSVLKAISLSGRQFMGNAIKFQHSQAEKNRLAAANKYDKQNSVSFFYLNNYLFVLIYLNLKKNNLKCLFLRFLILKINLKKSK